MKNIIFCLIFFAISGCTVTKVPEKKPEINNNALTAIVTIFTFFNEAKKHYDSEEKSILAWSKLNNAMTTEDVVNIINGSKELSEKSSVTFYSMYYLLKRANMTDDCLKEAECILRALASSGADVLQFGDLDFMAEYKADNNTFKFKHYDPEKIKPLMHDLASDLVRMQEDMKKQEIEENSKLPDTQPFEFTYINDKYVNAALALINTAKLEKHNIRDKNGNKTKEYRKPTIYGKPFFGDLYLYPRALLKQARSCEKASAYVRANIDNACKSAIVAGVKDWIGTARDPNISDVAWRAAANNAIIGDSIMFSHWAGMARVHQKSLNETGRISF
ncbi:hypothetical protein [Xenorhabdus bovienii]|uniref:hypothetical protein n=1 Tax=Xenorhabdus bovienii TaxID=40576 RepID=UPI0023B25B7C|nr:hypothetical protein [Xenorhabdus bovienii]MDE9528076.1 hypothetical protein [Xenorhabdus bovienii]MDE9536801.1 hypothetical protein [Xenorhabdus bovienii]